MALTSISPEELKQCLTRYLDQDYNVTNDQGVLEALARWEQYPVTKEILEITRIGKCVNELRKKTTNHELSRRAKELIRKWQSAPSAPLIAPSRPPVLNGHHSATPSDDRKRSVPVSNHTRPTLPVPALPSNHTRPILPVPAPPSDESKHVPPVRNGVKKPRLDPGHQPPPGERLSGHQPAHQDTRPSGHPPKPAQRPSGSQPGPPRPSPHSPSTFTPPLSLKPTTPSLNNLRIKPSSVSSPQLSSISPAVPTPNQRSELKLKFKFNGSGVTTVQSDNVSLSNSRPHSLSSDGGSRSSSPLVMGARDTSRSQRASLDRTATTLESSHLSHSSRISSPQIGGTRALDSSSSSSKSTTAPGKPPVKLNGSKSIPDMSTLLSSSSSSAPIKKNGHLPTVTNGSRKRYADGGIKQDGSLSSVPPGGQRDESSTKTSAWADGLGVKAATPPVTNGQLKSARSVADFKTSVHSPTVVEPSSRNAKKAKLSLASNEQTTLSRQNSSSSLVLMGTSARAPPPPPPVHRMTSSSTVESTAELMTRLHSEGNLSLVRSDIIERIANNQIVREVDDDDNLSSIVPAGVKSRGYNNRREPVLPPTLPAAEMARVKTEMVHKFLQMSVPSTSPPDMDMGPVSTPPVNGRLVGLLDRLKPETVVHEEALPSTASSSSKKEHRKNGKHKAAEKTTAAAKAEPLRKKSEREVVIKERTWEEEAWAQLPPIDPLFEYDIDTDLVPPLFCRDNITDADVDHLHAEHVVGVNGLYDLRNSWRNWTESMTCKVDESRVLHILPYVILD